MKIIANTIKMGNVLVYNDDLWMVIKPPEHTKPGKGGAYIQVELKNLKNKTKTNKRFSSSEYVKKAYLEQKDMQFLYFEDDNLVLMDNKTFDQVVIHRNLLGDKLPFLTDNMVITIEFYNDTTPINASLPKTVTMQIEYTDPIIKTATVTPSYKPAVLTNGLKVMVPGYLVSGENIIVNTDDSTFVERAKSK